MSIRADFGQFHLLSKLVKTSYEAFLLHIDGNSFGLSLVDVYYRNYLFCVIFHYRVCAELSTEARAVHATIGCKNINHLFKYFNTNTSLWAKINKAFNRETLTQSYNTVLWFKTWDYGTSAVMPEFSYSVNAVRILHSEEGSTINNPHVHVLEQ